MKFICGLSLFIEITQLFTLHRVTDIDDLITNVIGTLVGYFCFRIIHNFSAKKSPSTGNFKDPSCMKYVPVTIIVTTLILGFFS